MGGATTPAKKGTVSASKRDWESSPRTRSQTKNRQNSSTPSTASTISSTLSSNSSSPGTPLTPLTPQSVKDASLETFVPKPCESSSKEKDYKQSFVDKLQGKKSYSDDGYFQGRSTPLPEEKGSDYDTSASPDNSPISSKTRKPIRKGWIGVDKGGASKTLGSLDVQSDDADPGTESKDIDAEETGGASCEHSTGKGVEVPPYVADSRSSKISKTETTVDGPGVASDVSEVASSQDLQEELHEESETETHKLDEGEISIDTDSTAEYHASTTSGRAPEPVGPEIESDIESVEIVEPPPTTNSDNLHEDTKRADNMEFKPYKEMMSPSEIKMGILDIILKGDTDRKVGFVYIYKVKDSKGHVKIGKSRQKFGVRFKQWGAQCKLKPERICDPNQKTFQYYGIVEKLAQMELWERRKAYQCKVCPKGGDPLKDEKAEHKEWFEVTEKHALEVVERWRGWIVQQQPYRSDGTLRGIWVWKRDILMKANTVDFDQWVILTRSDQSAYAWHKIDMKLQKELPAILQCELVINAVFVVATCLWCVWGTFLLSVFTIFIIAAFVRYSEC